MKSAESYLDFDSSSRQGLIDQLSSSGYGEQVTQDQAAYEVNEIGL